MKTNLIIQLTKTPQSSKVMMQLHKIHDLDMTTLHGPFHQHMDG